MYHSQNGNVPLTLKTCLFVSISRFKNLERWEAKEVNQSIFVCFCFLERIKNIPFSMPGSVVVYFPIKGILLKALPFFDPWIATVG